MRKALILIASVTIINISVQAHGPAVAFGIGPVITLNGAGGSYKDEPSGLLGATIGFGAAGAGGGGAALAFLRLDYMRDIANEHNRFFAGAELWTFPWSGAISYANINGSSGISLKLGYTIKKPMINFYARGGYAGEAFTELGAQLMVLGF